jgi:hypothetical protein
MPFYDYPNVTEADVKKAMQEFYQEFLRFHNATTPQAKIDLLNKCLSWLDPNRPQALNDQDNNQFLSFTNFPIYLNKILPGHLVKQANIKGKNNYEITEFGRAMNNLQIEVAETMLKELTANITATASAASASAASAAPSQPHHTLTSFKVHQDKASIIKNIVSKIEQLKNKNISAISKDESVVINFTNTNEENALLHVLKKQKINFTHDPIKHAITIELKNNQTVQLDEKFLNRFVEAFQNELSLQKFAKNNSKSNPKK